MAFARTKIQPPQPHAGSLIERPALEARLAEALHSRRLVLLCAAAGFGKTSALARQVTKLPAGTALAWVACDEGDSPAQLFECLVAALEPYDLPWRTAPEALVRVASESSGPGPRRKMAAELINALDACEVSHGLIVVDDLHRIDHPAVFEFIDLLLERFTPRWTMVIATRQEPPLSLARLRVTGELAEFRMEDLRFDPAEARALGAAAGLPPEAADRLHERSQGWPVGLRLALSSPQRPGVAGKAIDRAVFDFLASEVIDRLEPGLRSFLLDCALLPELTAGRCAALTGDAHAALRLEQIERAGLFATPLNASEPTLRLHDLFREALEARLLRERPQHWRTLLVRAAASEPDAQRRIAWLLRAEAWDEAEDALSRAAEGLITQGQGGVLRTVLERFPPERREGARLQHVRAMVGWMRWDWETVIDATRRAAEARAAAGDVEGHRSARSYLAVALAGANRTQVRELLDDLLADPALQGETLARTLVAACWFEMRGDQRRVAPLWNRMLGTLQGVDNLARWYECSPLPPFAGLPGMRAGLQRYIDGALRLLPEQATPLRGMCQVVQGWLHLWAGNVAAAEACAESAAGDARWLARPVNVDSYSRSLQAVLQALRGRGSEAAATIGLLIEEVEASSEPLRIRVYLSLYVFVALRCAAIVDDAEAMARQARRLVAMEDNEHAWLSRHQRAGAAAYLATAEGDWVEACRLWRELLAREHWSDIYGQVIDARLRLADALLRRGRPPAEAAAILGPLFERIASEGEWGQVLMAGPATLDRLARADWAGTLDAAQTGLLSRWAGHAAGLLDGAQAPAAATPAADEGLSPRELEVMERIAAGDSNKLIARALDLSPHTVKRHVANILDKLALASRGQAAAWWREHR